MNFGEALEKVKCGFLVRRKGWNGKGQHVYLEDWLEGALCIGPCKRKYEPVLCLYTAQGKHQIGWLATQSDIISSDWEVVE